MKKTTKKTFIIIAGLFLLGSANAQNTSKYKKNPTPRAIPDHTELAEEIKASQTDFILKSEILASHLEYCHQYKQMVVHPMTGSLYERAVFGNKNDVCIYKETTHFAYGTESFDAVLTCKFNPSELKERVDLLNRTEEMFQGSISDITTDADITSPDGKPAVNLDGQDLEAVLTNLKTGPCQSSIDKTKN